MGFEKLTSKPPKLYKRLHVHTFLSGERSHIFFIFLSSYSAESHAYIHTLYTCSLKSTLLRYNLSRIKCTHLKCNLMNFNKCVHLLNSSLWSTHRTFLSSKMFFFAFYLLPLSPASGNQLYIFCHSRLIVPFLRISYSKWSHIMCMCLLCLASFTQHDIFKIHLDCYFYQLTSFLLLSIDLCVLL